jgi:hypothetical protein
MRTWIAWLRLVFRGCSHPRAFWTFIGPDEGWLCPDCGDEFLQCEGARFRWSE